MSVHLFAAEVHGIAAFHRPVVVELVLRFDEEAEVFVRLSEWISVCAPTFLICGEHAVVEAFRRRAFHAEVYGIEAVVTHLYGAVVVVYRRAVEWVAYHLSPMLPAGVDAMVVIVVHACDVVADVLRVVVVVRSALILRVYILEDEAAQPCAVLHVELGTEHHVLQIVHEVAALLPCVPLFALAVAVVVEQEHLAVVFEEVVGVYREAPQIGVKVQTRYPTAQLVAGAVGVESIGSIAAARYEGVPEVLYARAGRYTLHVAVAVEAIGLATELARHLQSQFEAEREERVLVAYL